ncbi:MAG: sulfatase [Cytophagales bacterium]|nr:sulfatase [Cytophagales bacterium]
MKSLSVYIAAILSILFLGISSCSDTEQGALNPNVVIIFLDDAGYGDFRPFSTDGIETPHVQTLAEEGVMYTNFHVPQAVCSASRSALISGCYPGRTKVFGAHGPFGRGLETNFPTMGEIFKSAGYKTAIFGKWHCGDQPETRPHMRGFDESCGLMYSNDMWKHHPENPEYWGKHPIKFWKNGKVKIEDVDFEHQKQLTRWYTEHAVDFINRHRDEPFLLYVPHSMPHVPIFAGEAFEGKSGIGLYGDVTLELDWSVGQIDNALKENGIDERTIVIFTSDNGPWISYGNHAGKTPFREAKATSFDGGNRSACIIKYPRELKANTSNGKAFFSVDLLPTLCHLADITLPDTIVVDGKNVWELISGNEHAKNPHDYYPLSTSSNFEGIMSGDGKWKLHIPHTYRSLIEPGMDGQAGKYETKEIELSLFDMENDPMESKNVIEDYPEVAERMKQMAYAHKEKFYSE